MMPGRIKHQSCQAWLSMGEPFVTAACFPLGDIASFKPRLSNGMVHLWHADLRLVPLEGEGTTILSADERERADRFKLERDRRRFRAARVFLRRLLAGYLAVDPAAVHFRYGEHGKPECAGLSFNMSHSGECAVVAVAERAQVGVDVEHGRPLLDADTIAATHFPREWQQISALPPSERHAAFFTCWTAKEAVLKALGYGLSQSLSAFEISVAPTDPLRLLWIDPQLAAGTDWQLKAFRIGEDYLGAIALERIGN